MLRSRDSSSGVNFQNPSVRTTFKRTPKADTLLLFLAILASGSLVNRVIPLLVGLTGVIFVLVIFMVAKKKEINRAALKRAVPLIIVLLTIFFAKLIFQTNNLVPTLSLLRMMGTIILAVIILLYFSSSPQSLLSSLYIALVVVMVHAICSFVAWFFVRENLAMVPELDYKTFYGIFYYNNAAAGTAYADLVSLMGFEFQRNAGIFWEPGILQIYMNILLFMSLYVFRHPKISLIAAFAVLTTWSSTGLAILCIQLLYYFFRTKMPPGKAVMLGGFLIIILFFSVGNLVEKIQGDRAGSSYARALDTLTAINVAKEHPLLGIGVDWDVYRTMLDKNVAVVEMAGTEDDRAATDTNSIVNYFVFFGVPIGAAVLYSLCRQKVFPNERLVFGLVIIMALSTEPIGFFLFPWMLIFSRYVLPGIPQKIPSRR